MFGSDYRRPLLRMLTLLILVFAVFVTKAT